MNRLKKLLSIGLASSIGLGATGPVSEAAAPASPETDSFRKNSHLSSFLASLQNPDTTVLPPEPFAYQKRKQETAYNLPIGFHLEPDQAKRCARTAEFYLAQLVEIGALPKDIHNQIRVGVLTTPDRRQLVLRGPLHMTELMSQLYPNITAIVQADVSQQAAVTTAQALGTPASHDWKKRRR